MSSAANEASGSYAFPKIPAEEIDRLVRQGSATWAAEREFLAWAGLRWGDHVLDAGCGPGIISGLLATEVGETGSVLGVDVAPELMRVGRQLATPGVSFETGSILDLGAYRGRFDFAYVRLVLQHLPDRRRAIAEVQAALKPGGRLCILDSDEHVLALHPEPEGLRGLMTETQALQRDRGGDRFVGGKLAMLLKDAGFDNVDAKVILITPEMIGRASFLDSVLAWRPLLFPAEQREEAKLRVAALRAIADATMVSGHNGSFVVCGRRATGTE